MTHNSRNINLYWSVYKNLEKEVMDLSNQIHFDDKQLSIYSVKISELLLRCSVEIESISKDLYFILGGEMPCDGDLYFDTHCLQLIEDRWKVGKKQLLISAQNFYFHDIDNIVLKPLYKANKRGTSGSDWKQAYQAVKHNRALNLSKGNIRNLLRALGALFILNIYFKDEVFNLGTDSNATNFPINLGSDIFSIKLHKWFYYDAEYNYSKKVDFEECIYLIKYTDECTEKNKQACDLMFKHQQEEFYKHPKTIEYLQKNNLKNYTGGNLMWEVLGQEDYVQLINNSFQKSRRNLDHSEFEAIINKDNII